MDGYIVPFVIGYVLGNINFGYIIGKLTRGIDIRKYGSGNAGATNVNRILGPKAAVITLVGDLLKGVAAVIIGRHIAGDTGAVLSAIAVVCGHNWPAVMGFKGGKGIATSLGILLSLDYRVGMILLILGILIILVTRYVSLASVTAAFLYPVLVIAFRSSPQMVAFSIVLSLFALVRHRGNIKRLLKGEETKLSFKKSVKKEEK